MKTFKALLRSMRLRTLPLSLSGAVLGILLASADYRIDPVTVVLIMSTTVCLQILSNLSNDLGDVLHGTDTAERLGPSYGLNSGELTVSGMKGAIWCFVALCIVSGTAMVWRSFGTLLSLTPILLLLLGAGAIAAAMKYTLGRNPYGYRGLGDIYVFIFFGLVSVMGSYLVATHTLSNPLLMLPAAAIGFFSMGVLNVNNIRDMDTDRANRVTVAIRLGLRGARIYQTVLVVLGWACMTAFCLLRISDPWHYLYFLSLPLFVIHLRGVWTKEGRALDRMLPLLVTGTFLFALLSGLGFNVFLLQR